MTYRQIMILSLAVGVSLANIQSVEAATLSRKAAKRLIEKHKDFSPTTLRVKFKPGILEHGKKDGVWLIKVGWTPRIMRTELGKSLGGFWEHFKTYTCLDDSGKTQTLLYWLPK